MLKKGFLRNNIGKNIPIYKFLIGIILGLLAAFFLYEILYLFRETLRVFSKSEEHDIWILTDEEVDFYNLIFAFIATIMGQSICLIYWFDTPKTNFNARPTRLGSVVHEQRLLNWYFLNWFAKLAFVFGIMFGFPGFAGHYEFSFFPDFNYFFILIIIVLFLQTWNGILLVFKAKAFKWMLISALIVSSVSYGLSKINIVAYKELNNRVIEKRISPKYQLNLPESSVFKKQEQKNWLPKVSVVFSKDSTIKEPIYLLGNSMLGPRAIALKMDSISKARSNPKFWNEQANFNFQIDKNMPMRDVERMKEELGHVDFRWLDILVLPRDRKFEDFYYQSIQYSYLSIFNQYNILYETNKEKEFSNIIKIECAENQYLINNNIVSVEAFKIKLQNLMQKDKNYVIEFYFGEQVTFSQYVGTYSTLWELVNELRNIMSIDIYGRDYADLEGEEREIILDRYPFRLMEMFTDSKAED